MKQIKRISKSTLIIWSIIFLVLIVLVNYVFANPLLNKKPLSLLAREIIQKCSNVKSKPSCYDKEIPLLMDDPNKLSLEETFQLTKILQNQDQSYIYCHVLAHKLAEKEAKKDLSKWSEVITRCPSGMCSNGCIHGAFMEKYKAESLSSEQIEAIKPELKTICHSKENWNPTGLQQGSCYHALGHLLMYATNADIQKSLSLCKELAISEDGNDTSSACFHGAFMQIFQPLEPEDIALVKKLAPSKETVQEFCSRFSSREKSACWSEAWPLSLKQVEKPNGLVNYCTFLEEEFRQECYTFIFYIMPIQFKFETEALFKYCKSMPENLGGECFGQAALRLIQTDYSYIDRAINLCNQALPYDTDQKCFAELADKASFSFPKGSKEYGIICQSLPKAWQNKCYKI